MAQICDVILFLKSKDEKWSSNFKSLLEVLLQRLCKTDFSVAIANDLSKEKKSIDSAKAVIAVVQPDDLSDKDSDIKSLVSNTEIQSKLFVIFNADTTAEQQASLQINSTTYTFSDESLFTEGMNEVLKGNNLGFLTMLDLAYDISSLVLPEKDQKKQIGEKVFFAAVTPDQEANRDTIKREMKQFGYTVAQLRNTTTDPAKIKTNIEKHLSNSIVAVYIYGDNYGKILEGENISLTEYHHKISSDYINSLDEKQQESAVYRFLWIQPNSKPESESQKIFIEQLKRDINSLVNAEIIQVPIEDFKSIIRKRLLQKSNPNKIKANKNKSEKKIYLIHEKNDIEKLQGIADSFSKRGFDVIYTDFEKSSNLVEAHRQNLVSSQAFIIYYSGQNDFWVNSKIKDIIKAPGYGKQEPFTAKAVLIENGTPPLLPEDFLVIKNEKSKPEDLLKPFLEKLNKNG